MAAAAQVVQEEEEEEEEEAEVEEDGEEEQQEEKTYFPAALSRPGGLPTDFHFELFLLDSLRLEAALFPADAHEPLVFRTVDECSRYCQRFVGTMCKG